MTYLYVYIIYNLYFLFNLLSCVEEEPPTVPPLPELPEKATYILVGGGTASFAAYRAIRKGDPKAQVCMIV